MRNKRFAAQSIVWLPLKNLNSNNTTMSYISTYSTHSTERSIKRFCHLFTISSFSPPCDEHNVLPSVPRKVSCDPASDAGARTGDDGNLVLHFEGNSDILNSKVVRESGRWVSQDGTHGYRGGGGDLYLT